MFFKMFNVFSFIKFLKRNGCRNIIYSRCLVSNRLFLSFDYLDKSFYGFLDYELLNLSKKNKDISILFSCSPSDCVV